MGIDDDAPPSNYSGGKGIPLQVIVVQTSQEAGQVLAELKQGKDFGQIAKKVSIDPTASTGGYMGRFEPGDLRAELRDALKGLQPGQYSRVVHIPSGYTIVKIMQAGPTGNAERARSFDLSATGAVKYILDVSGLREAEALISRAGREPGWNADPQNVCDLRTQSLQSAITQSKKMLATPANFSSRLDEAELHRGLAEIYVYLGQMDLALDQYNQAYKIAAIAIPAAIPDIQETLGIAYLHKAEMDNDVFHDPGNRCVFPIAPADALRKTTDGQRAIEYFARVLKQKPKELDVRWLLNLAYMMVGEYPAKVPKQYLIPPEAFQSKEDVGRFVDVAQQSGLRSFGTSGGVIVDDFENNGRLDVVTSGWASCAPMHYFHNNGDGTFSEATKKAGLGGEVGGLNMIQADYNNDGCTDILVLRGGWEFPQRKSLLRNNCDGTFTDVTLASGLGEPTSTQAAVWVDVNNDGWLDLFVGNERGPAQLFINNHDGTFTDVASAAEVAGDGSAFIKGVVADDYDNDGWPDLYASNATGRNFLYHNNHDGTFTEVGEQAGVPGSGRDFATWFFDYDNDGWPDVFVESYVTSLDETARDYLNLPHNASTLKLYRNMHDGTFRDVTEETGLNKVYMAMGANFGDIDNDGYLDMYIGTGTPSYGSLAPNVLFRNHDGKYFVDVTTSSGTGELHKGHGVAFADMANSGNEDIVTVIGGAAPGDSHMLRLFENPGNGNDWINVKLVGVKTNRSAIGARIAVTVQDDGQPRRSIYRTVGSGGSFGASPLEQHIGLGKNAKIVSLDVVWPTSHTYQHFSDVAKNQFIEIKEFSNTYTKLDRKPVRLGGAPEVKSAARSTKQAGGKPCVGRCG